MMKKIKMIWRIILFGSRSWHKNCELILVQRVKRKPRFEEIEAALASQLKEVLGVIERIPRKKVKTDGSRMWIDFGNTKIKDVEEMVENGENNGYNDNDWWTKYKPSEVKEDENITWEIDWDNMQAIYKIHRR